MALHSPKRKVSDAENKLRVLCCLSSLGMATLDQLWPFVAQLELMEYMQLCLYVDELKKDGALAVGSHAIEGCLYLTDEGTKTLSMFERKMPAADRDRIEREAPVYFARLSERRQVRAIHEKPLGVMSRAACMIREGDVPTLFLRVVTEDEALISTVVSRFRVVASRLLRLLYTTECASDGCEPLPLAKTLEEALDSALHGKPMLYAYSKHEHCAVISVKDERAVYVIGLLMPSKEIAESWARAALLCGDALAKRITATFDAKGVR